METYPIRWVFVYFFSWLPCANCSLSAHLAIVSVIEKTGIWPHYLAMNKDYRSQKPPCSSLTVHVKHAQDLEEADAPESTVTSKPSFLVNHICINWLNDKNEKVMMLPDSRRGKHLTVGPHAQHNDWGNDHYQICEGDIKTRLWLL